MLWDEQVTLGQGVAVPTCVHSLMCPDGVHLRLQGTESLLSNLRLGGLQAAILGCWDGAYFSLGGCRFRFSPGFSGPQFPMCKMVWCRCWRWPQ